MQLCLIAGQNQNAFIHLASIQDKSVAWKQTFAAVYFHFPQKERESRKKKQESISEISLVLYLLWQALEDSAKFLGESGVSDPIWDILMRSLAVIASVVKAAFNLKFMALLYQN